LQYRSLWSWDPTARGVEGDSPRNQLSLQSFLDLGSQISVFLSGRYVGSLPHQHIAAYTTMDATLQWRPFRRVELALSGRNLFGDAHAEFGSPRTNVIGRTVFATGTLRF